jgi:DNA-binding NtrC family response regulator
VEGRQERKFMKKILVADQEEVLCMLYAEELMEEGYDVVTVSDSKDFMGVLKAESPDLLLLDIKMSTDDNGLLFRDIRSNHNSMPVILCTTYVPSMESSEYLYVDDIVMKSSNFDELKLKIARILGNAGEPVSPRTRLVGSEAEKQSQEQMRLFY